MNFKGISSIIRSKQRKQESENDIPDKFKIINILRSEGIFGFTDKYIVFDKHTGEFVCASDHITQDMAIYCFWHKPDVYIPLNKLIIEIDGWNIHQDGKFIPRDTELRNKHYGKAQLLFIVLQKETLKLQKKQWREFLIESLADLGVMKS